MSAPLSFPSTTPNHSLPLLFSGQAQKEFYVNQAFSVIDGLMMRSVVESRQSEPSEPAEGACYLVAAPASGAWSGREDCIAIFLAGAWHFITPYAGMTVYDQDIGAFRHFNSSWQRAVGPDAVSGGTTIDTEARLAVIQIIEALRAVGVLPHAI